MVRTYQRRHLVLAAWFLANAAAIVAIVLGVLAGFRLAFGFGGSAFVLPVVGQVSAPALLILGSVVAAGVLGYLVNRSDEARKRTADRWRGY